VSRRIKFCASGLALLAFATPAGSAGVVSFAGADRYLSQRPDGPGVSLKLDVPMLFLNCSREGRRVAIVEGEIPADLPACIEALATAPNDSCEFEWRSDDGPVTHQVWWTNARHSLFVCTDPVGWIASCGAGPSWRLTGKAIAKHSEGLTYNPGRLITAGVQLMTYGEGDGPKIVYGDWPPRCIALSPGSDAKPDSFPVPLKRVPPDYPDDARARNEDGLCVLQLLVGPDGAVEAVVVVDSQPAFDDASRAAAVKWRYRPALRAGHGVAAWVAAPFRYSLN